MKNLMEDIAKLLGLELDEEFIIEEYINNPYRITKEGLYNNEDDCVILGFRELLMGNLSVTKPILTRKEKEYLENFLRPYKDEIEDISSCYSVERYLAVTIKRGKYKERITLPYILEDDLQFKMLETGQYFTIRELGLFEEEK